MINLIFRLDDIFPIPNILTSEVAGLRSHAIGSNFAGAIGPFSAAEPLLRHWP